MDENTRKIEYKTKKIGLWIAVITLIGLVVGLMPQLIPFFSSSSPTEKTEEQIKVDTVTPSDSDEKQSPLSHLPSPSPSKPNITTVFDTVHLLLDAPLSRNSIQVDNKPAKVIERSGISATVVVTNQENHTFSIRDGDRNCEVSSYIDGNETITIKLIDCK